MAINPWLAEKVSELRERVSEEDLRTNYELNCKQGPLKDLSWENHVLYRALNSAMNRTPFLRTRLARFDLPEKTKKGLYLLGVDCMADLLQVTEEELLALEREKGYDARAVKDYLEGRECRLYHSPERTCKMSRTRGLWRIPLPGTTLEFNLNRPTLYPEWFDEYYRRFGHFDKEEEAASVFESAPAIVLRGENIPDDYKEFFSATENLFDTYEKCCAECGIQPGITRPVTPDADVRRVYREGVKAIVDIFERTDLLKDFLPGEFLSATDEKKLNIVESLMDQDTFQLLLIVHVEQKIDIENIVIFLKECIEGKHSRYYAERAKPIDPILKRLICTLRNKVSDEMLRERYREALEQTPGLSWEEFIIQAAMAEP